MIRISPPYLHECLSYSPETGVLTWRARPREHFSSERVWKIWNVSFSGKTTRKTLDCRGYQVLRLTINGKNYSVRAHRVIFAMQTGGWPTAEIDHKNRIKDDNRWANLRSATHAENQHNCGIPRNNTSGFLGVTLNKGRWQARIKANGQRRNLGRFGTAEDGYAAYLKAKAELHPFWEHPSG